MSSNLNVGARAARFQQYRAMQQLASGVGIRKARAMQGEARRTHTKLSDYIAMRSGLVKIGSSHSVNAKTGQAIRTNAHVLSRVHRAWSDMLRSKPLHQRPVDPLVMQRSVSVPSPIVHSDGTRSMRGGPCLFDDCTMIEYRYGSTDPWLRDWVYHWQEEAGVEYVGRSILKRSQHVYADRATHDPDGTLTCAGKIKVGRRARVAYHMPIGSLPAIQGYDPKAKARAELASQIAAWRQAKQLDYALALMGD